jgi:hypothetical protein
MYVSVLLLVVLGCITAGVLLQAPPGKSESKGDERLREMILSDVLDDRPTVSWDSIAGLNKAKQALQVSKPTLPFLSWTIFHAQVRIRS